MHFEINTDAATLHAVAEHLRGNDVTPDDIEKVAELAAEKVLDAKVGKDDTTVRQALNQILTYVERHK
jgi:hypothetical protein